MTSDTTNPSYWLNWRFLLCALWISTAVAVASFLIWKYEGFNKSRSERRENPRDAASIVYEDEAWRTCLRKIRPAWLLAYRMISFLVLLALLIANAVVDGGAIFYFYTQWTFTLVVLYFGLASSFSIYGGFFKHKKDGVNTVKSACLDAQQGTHLVPTLNGASIGVTNLSQSSDAHQEPYTRKPASVWGYIFQIIFQTCAGAVVVTDTVFWLLIYPFMTSKDFKLDIFVFGMHSINAVIFLGDTFLNCMRFPLFRLAYFVLWTVMFVIVQWIIHACVSLWWPYPFLDLSSKYAPLWYLGVGVALIPCYGIFALIVRLKHWWLSKKFPGSYQSVR